MPAHVLVLDIGKTNARALLFDRAGSVLSAERTTFPAAPSAPYRQLPAAAMLVFAEQAIAVAAARVGAVSVIPVTHGAALALVDAHGLVLPLLDYEDAGPEQASGYDAERPAFAETFSPALPLGLNLGRQLAWLAETRPEAFANARAFLTLPQFIGWHLSGRVASEPTSLGCHSDLWAPARRDYSSLVYARGWRAKFPPLRDAGEVIGSLRPELAARLGIAAPVTILNGLHDSNASLIPHLSRADRFTMVSTGTWFIAMGVGALVSASLPGVRDCLANVDVRGRAYPCARFMGGREYAALAADAPRPTLADLSEVTKAIAGRRMILPSHAEGGGPFPGARGAAPAGVTAAEASLYLALMTATCIDLINAAGPIVIVGPAAANPLYAALLQALHPDRPVATARDTDATARGAALLALGIAVSPDLVPAAWFEVPGLADYARAWAAKASDR